MADPDDHTAHNRSTYDHIAQAYRDRQCQNETTGERLFSRLETAFVSSLPAEGIVADVGCGPALDSERFVGLGFNVMGIDLSAGMLAMATERLPHRLTQADLRALPIDTGRLDGIWCAASLLHIPEADTAAVLQEFTRILRRHGNLALITALGFETGFEPVHYVPGEKRWFVYRQRDRLEEQLHLAGFTINSAEEIAGSRRWFTVLARVG